MLEEQAHRVALIAEGGLDADEDVAETLAQHLNAAAVAVLAAGSRTPGLLDFGEPGLAPHMIGGRNARGDVGIRAEAGRVALQDAVAERVNRCRHLDLITAVGQRLQRVVQGLEDREIRRGAGAAGIGREVEQHDRDAALGPLRPAQAHQPGDARGEHPCPLLMHDHQPAMAVAGGGPAAEGHRPDAAIEFRDRDHHGGLDRH